MGKDPGLSARIKTLRWRQTELSTLRTKAMEDGTFAIAMIQNFYKAWKAYVEKNGGAPETIREGYFEGLKTLPKDNPNTPKDEGKTEEDLLNAIEKITGKPFNADEIDTYNLEQIENNLGVLKGLLRKEIGKTSFFDSQIDDVKRQIQNLRVILETPSDPNTEG